MSVFTWTPDFGAQKRSEPKVQRIQMGDGYEQRAAFGLNTNPKTWSLTFSLREETEYQEIRDFLDARGAVESFDWTPPGTDEASKFVCRSWDETIEKATRYSISATFDEVFEP